MNPTKPIDPNPVDQPQNGSDPLELYRKYLSELEQQTGIRVRSVLSEEQFRALWQRLNPENRQRMETILRQGFSKRAKEFWPETEAILKAFREGQRDPAIVAEIKQLLVH